MEQALDQELLVVREVPWECKVTRGDPFEQRDLVGACRCRDDNKPIGGGDSPNTEGVSGSGVQRNRTATERVRQNAALMPN